MSQCSNCQEYLHVCARNVPIFASLGPEELLEVNSLIRSVEYEKGELLFGEGDIGTNLYIVRSGRIKLYTVSSDGRQQIIRILEPGDFFGELALFQDAAQNCFAEAMEYSQVCLLGRSDMKALLNRKPSVAVALLEAMSARLAQAERFIGDLALKNVEERLVSWLMMEAKAGLFREGEIEIRSPLSREELAHLLGTTVETVSRRLNALQAEGFLTLQGHRSIIIRDLDGLKRILVR
ncbi:MAG: Crp/Fnr family transcriptional regulator [Firmicutes bacterium]|nr:Crp/Fnr family transcriptional regulator [Bacillota bacterium]